MKGYRSPESNSELGFYLPSNLGHMARQAVMLKQAQLRSVPGDCLSTAFHCVTQTALIQDVLLSLLVLLQHAHYPPAVPLAVFGAVQPLSLHSAAVQALPTQAPWQLLDLTPFTMTLCSVHSFMFALKVVPKRMLSVPRCTAQPQPV